MPKRLIIGKEAYCDFQSIQAGVNALKKLPDEQKKELIILSGEYHEIIDCRLSNVEISGLGTVIIRGSYYALEKMSDGEHRGTFRSATLFIEGVNIRLENLTIVNDAGQGTTIGQAISVFNYGHHVTFVNCLIKGHQDTLCTGPLPERQKNGLPFQLPELMYGLDYCYQEYDHCYLEGTVDFIFGGGDAVFTNCQIHSLTRKEKANGYITAASTPQKQSRGFQFNQCMITAETEDEYVFLGRPWRPYAKSTFNHCFFGKHIVDEGWDNWGNSENELTAQYTETDCWYAEQPKRPKWVTQK